MPPPPPNPPTVTVLQTVVSCAGEVSDFTLQVQIDLRAKMAAETEVQVNQVQLEVEAASVQLTFTIELSSEESASAAEMKLASVLASPDAASAFLSTPSLPVVVESIDVLPTASWPPPPASTTEEYMVLGIFIFAGSFLLLVLAVLLRMWRKSVAKKKRKQSLALALGVDEAALEGARAVQEALTSRRSSTQRGAATDRQSALAGLLEDIGAPSRRSSVTFADDEEARSEMTAEMSAAVAAAAAEAVRKALPEPTALPAPSFCAALSAVMTPQQQEALKRASLPGLGGSMALPSAQMLDDRDYRMDGDETARCGRVMADGSNRSMPPRQRAKSIADYKRDLLKQAVSNRRASLPGHSRDQSPCSAGKSSDGGTQPEDDGESTTAPSRRLATPHPESHAAGALPTPMASEASKLSLADGQAPPGSSAAVATATTSAGTSDAPGRLGSTFPPKGLVPALPIGVNAPPQGLTTERAERMQAAVDAGQAEGSGQGADTKVSKKGVIAMKMAKRYAQKHREDADAIRKLKAEKAEAEAKMAAAIEAAKAEAMREAEEAKAEAARLALEAKRAEEERARTEELARQAEAAAQAAAAAARQEAAEAMQREAKAAEQQQQQQQQQKAGAPEATTKAAEDATCGATLVIPPTAGRESKLETEDVVAAGATVRPRPLGVVAARFATDAAGGGVPRMRLKDKKKAMSTEREERLNSAVEAGDMRDGPKKRGGAIALAQQAAARQAEKRKADAEQRKANAEQIRRMQEEMQATKAEADLARQEAEAYRVALLQQGPEPTECSSAVTTSRSAVTTSSCGELSPPSSPQTPNGLPSARSSRTGGGGGPTGSPESTRGLGSRLRALSQATPHTPRSGAEERRAARRAASARAASAHAASAHAASARAASAAAAQGPSRDSGTVGMVKGADEPEPDFVDEADLEGDDTATDTPEADVLQFI